MNKKHPQKTYKLKIGSNIRKWRDLKRVKQKDLAAALQLSATAISNIENDKTNITLHQLEDIALTLNIPAVQLFSDPIQHMSIPVNKKIPTAQHPRQAYILDAIITGMQKKDEEMRGLLNKILEKIAQVASSK